MDATEVRCDGSKPGGIRASCTGAAASVTTPSIRLRPVVTNGGTIDRFQNAAYDLVIEGESYRARLKPGQKGGQKGEKKGK